MHDRKASHGYSFHPRANPSMLNNAPWYNGTLARIDKQGDATYTVNDLCNEFRDKNGLFATDTTNRIPIEVRFVELRVFAIANTITTSPFQVIVYDTDYSDAPMQRLYTNPGYVRFGTIGYRWPESMSRTPHRHDLTNIVFKLDVTGTTPVLIQLYLMWRSLNGSSYTSEWREVFSPHQIASPCSSMLELVPRFEEINLASSSKK